MDALTVRRPGVSTERYEHLSDMDISRFAARQCGPDEEAAVEAHILTCPECVDRLRQALAIYQTPAEH